MRTNAFATWDEAELMEISMTALRGLSDANLLGVAPRAMRDVLGVV
jgi:NADH dehydrogenase